MRQIVEAFGIKPQFEVGVVPKGLSLYTMTEYKDVFPYPVLFPKKVPSNTLAAWLAKKQLPQFHCAGKRFWLGLLISSLPCMAFSCSRDGEICSCDVFLQRRSGAGPRQRGQAVSAISQSGHL